MTLSGRQLKQFRDLVVDTFTLPQFDQLLKYHFDRKRENIALGDDFKEIAFKVIEAADSEGWLQSLIVAVQTERPHHAKLKAFMGKLDSIPQEGAEGWIRWAKRQIQRHYRLLLLLLAAVSVGVFIWWYLTGSEQREAERLFLDGTDPVASVDVNDLQGWINHGRELVESSKPPFEGTLQIRVTALQRRLWVARVKASLAMILPESVQQPAKLFQQLRAEAPDVSADPELLMLLAELDEKIAQLQILLRLLPSDSLAVFTLCENQITGQLPSTLVRAGDPGPGQRIAQTAKSTGVLLVDGSPRATAFLVAPNLVMTANFAVQDVVAANRAGTWSVRRGHRIAIDFGRDRCTQESASIPVTGVRFMSDWPASEISVALLEIASQPLALSPLRLSASRPSAAESAPVALVGFPQGGGVEAPGVKSVMPGQVVRATEAPTGAPPDSLVYDLDSASGTSGAPVIDLGTGAVIGLHWGGSVGDSTKRGIAVPMWKILESRPVQAALEG